MTIKNPVLTGSELAVTGLTGCNAAIRNDSAEILYASKKPGITAGADDVLAIPAAGSAMLYGISGAVYLSGTGAATVVSSDYNENPFKYSAQSGGSGADDVARAAISSHSGNAEIHVSADEKAAWTGKAEFSDIPSSLPANGGNSDTVDGLHDRNLLRYTDLNGIETSVNSIVESGIFRNRSWTDHPADCADSQGILVVLNYSSGNAVNVSGTIGTSTLWLRQIFMSPHDNIIWSRSVVNKAVSDWVKFSDGGNAATLEDHSAAEFVLKTDYDALEARVAALE